MLKHRPWLQIRHRPQPLAQAYGHRTPYICALETRTAHDSRPCSHGRIAANRHYPWTGDLSGLLTLLQPLFHSQCCQERGFCWEKASTVAS